MSNGIKPRTVYMICRTDKTEDDGTDIYVGSTSQPLRIRLSEHRSRAKNFIKWGCSENNRLYKRMNDVGVRNWQIISLLTFACSQKTIREFEREWVTATGADLIRYHPLQMIGMLIGIGKTSIPNDIIVMCAVLRAALAVI